MACRTYFIRLRVGADMGNAVEVSLPASPPPTPASTGAVPPADPAAPATNNSTAGQCTYKGKSYSLGEYQNSIRFYQNVSGFSVRN